MADSHHLSLGTVYGKPNAPRSLGDMINHVL